MPGAANNGSAEMSDLLRVVNTTKKVQSNIDKFESLSLAELTPSANNNKKTRKAIVVLDEDREEQNSPTADLTAAANNGSPPVSDSTFVEANRLTLNPALQESQSKPGHAKHDSAVFVQKAYLSQPPPASLPDDAIQVLKSQPGIEDVKAVLQYLHYGIDGKHDFDVRVTGPKSSMLLRVLAATTLPDLWHTLRDKRTHSEDESQMRDVLEQCFFSPAGIEALLTQAKELTHVRTTDSSYEVLHSIIDVLQSILSGPNTLLRLLDQATVIYPKEIQRKLFSQTLGSLISGSKILSTVSQVSATAQGFELHDDERWLASGEVYSRWLGQNIVRASTKVVLGDDQYWTALAQYVKRGMALGHKDVLIRELYTSLLLGQRALWTPLSRMLQALPSYDQKVVFDTILRDVSSTFFGNTHEEALFDPEDSRAAKAVSGVAALISGIVSNNKMLMDHMIEVVAAPGNTQASAGIGTKRALIAFLAQHQSKLQTILDRSLNTFGDKLYIQHAPIMQQESLARTIILALSYLRRDSIDFLKQPPISTLSMRAVSDRLASSIPRVRLLGMVIGVAMSRCIDEPGKIMDFGVEEMESEEVVQLLKLVEIDDKIGVMEDLHEIERKSGKPQTIPAKRKTKGQPLRKAKLPQKAKVLAIEEVSSSSDDEDDLIPYRKPDSDPEDSDEDPTLLNRNKPSAPIYMNDLIKQLQLHDKPDITALALKTAPALIRRKANFGTELSDNIYHVASALVNMQDTISNDEQAGHRLQALIACFVSKPKEMGKYLTNFYLKGDLSLSQRSVILTTIGLGTRELAGFKDHGNQNDPTQTDFPSQRLPPHLQPRSLTPATQESKQLSSNSIASLTTAQAHETIRPLALAAADAATGPNALKIRTFSSRMDVEKRKTSEREERTKRVPKDLYNVIVNYVYLPLCSPMAAVASGRGANTNNTLFFPAIVKMHLQTLTLVLNTLGPVGMGVPAHQSSVTHETLGLLLGLHSNARLSVDATVLPAMLHLLLSLIDLTVEIGVAAQERLITQFGREVAELVNWANSLEERISVPVDTRGSDGVEQDGSLPWTVLAAGIAVRWVEMGKRFQGSMLGLGDDGL